MAEQQRGQQEDVAEQNLSSESFEAVRRRLPDTRSSITHKFSVEGTEGYIIVGVYDDGSPAEVFLKVAKEGSTLGGLMDGIGILMSISLQHRVPLIVITTKLKGTQFLPSGFTKSEQIPNASSILDYIACWMELVFIEEREPCEPTSDGETENPI